ncbi:MAG: alpha/beta hydrolase, partial [Patescibacteria group bacterium]
MVAKNIVILHGWGATREKLFPLRDKLEKRDWKVYLPKIPGLDIPLPSQVWGLKEYADFLSRACHQFFKGEKYFIFGYSFGGRVALKASRFSPSPISGIILCSAAGLSRGSLLKRSFFWTLAKLGKLFLVSPPI